MHGWHHNVAGHLVIKLLNTFTKVCLSNRNAARFQIFAHLAFFGHHRLTFDKRFGAVFFQNFANYAVMFRTIGCPVNVNTILFGVGLKLLQIFGQVGQRVFLDLRGTGAQFLPFRQNVHLLITLLAQVPQAFVMKAFMRNVFDELFRRLGVVDWFDLHSRAPFRISAM